MAGWAFSLCFLSLGVDWGAKLDPPLVSGRGPNGKEVCAWALALQREESISDTQSTPDKD